MPVIRGSRWGVLVWIAAAGLAVGEPPDEPAWEPLQKHPVPKWLADAKFGIYAHWGVYSVPAFDSEWYPRNMYIEGSRAYRHHVETYGDLSEFGYKDFIPLFRGEHFDAEAWADLYARSGAKFAGPVVEHHDGFSMWASEINRWNAGSMGPRRDVAGELIAAIRKRGLKVVVTFHHAYNLQGYFSEKEGWDTADPQYGDLYGKFRDPKLGLERWLAKIREVIDGYRPDQIWFDFGLGKIPDAYKRRMAAYYYGREAAWGKEVILSRKHEDLPEGVGVLDIERGKMEGTSETLWQTDDSIAVNTWCYTDSMALKSAGELIDELVDIVSKNGVLLLNVCPKADGTIPADQQGVLLEMGRWLEGCGEAIYGTRPWVIHGEGPTLYDPGRGFGDKERPAAHFTGQDLRFTTKGDVFYVICLGRPAPEVVVESLRIQATDPGAEIRLLGYDESLRYAMDWGRELRIWIPEAAREEGASEYASVIRLEGFRIEANPFMLPGSITLRPGQAVFEGDHIRVDSKLGREMIGFWDNPRERVHWLVRIPRPGRYLVRGEFSAGMGNSEVTLNYASQSLQGKILKTASWEGTRFVELGHLQFEQAGVYQVTLQASDFRHWRPVHVYRLQFAQP